MVKKLSILLVFFFCISASFCYAQKIPDDEGEGPFPKSPKPKPKPSTKPVSPPLSVKFQGNHDFYLTVDEEPYGKSSKDNPKSVRLDPGVHKLVFEEADSTGERLEHYIKITKEMTKQ